MESEEVKKNKSGRICTFLGWILFAISLLGLFGSISGGLKWGFQRDQAIQAFLKHQDGNTFVSFLIFIIGFNIFSVFACIFGIVALILKNPRGKILIIASLLVFSISSGIEFLPSSESKNQHVHNPTIVTHPQSEFQVTFNYHVKKKVVSSGAIESIAFENTASESIPYLRVEFMQGIDIHTIENNFQAILENHAHLSGLIQPEITEGEEAIGKVGTYSGIKKVEDLTVKIYGKMIVGKSSCINCMVVEPLEVFPSKDSVDFLNSIKLK